MSFSPNNIIENGGVGLAGCRLSGAGWVQRGWGQESGMGVEGSPCSLSSQAY